MCSFKHMRASTIVYTWHLFLDCSGTSSHIRIRFHSHLQEMVDTLAMEMKTRVVELEEVWICREIQWKMPWLFRLYKLSRWWFQIFFMFTPILGKIPILNNLFQLGWNHQLVIYPPWHWHRPWWPWKMIVERWMCFWKGPFSGAMLVSGSVGDYITQLQYGDFFIIPIKQPVSQRCWFVKPNTLGYPRPQQHCYIKRCRLFETDLATLKIDDWNMVFMLELASFQLLDCFF